MNDANTVMAAWRRLLFGAGIVLFCFGAVGVVISYIVPFSLVHLRDGSLMVNPWDDRVLHATIVVSVLGSVLTAFRPGHLRLFFIAIGPILAFLAAVGYLQNHV